MSTRVVYAVRCSWWGSIDEAGTKDGTPTGLPCCPCCGSPLLEVLDFDTWWEGVDQAEAGGRPDYRAFIEWLRGRCFPSLDDARAVFDAERSG